MNQYTRLPLENEMVAEIIESQPESLTEEQVSYIMKHLDEHVRATRDATQERHASVINMIIHRHTISFIAEWHELSRTQIYRIKAKYINDDDEIKWDFIYDDKYRPFERKLALLMEVYDEADCESTKSSIS
jgi:hypothetical protein